MTAEVKFNISKWVPIASIESLHSHPVKAGRPMSNIKNMTCIKDKGIVDEPGRKFDHRPDRMKTDADRDPNLRHICFIHRTLLKTLRYAMEHELGDAKKNGLQPGDARANVESRPT